MGVPSGADHGQSGADSHQDPPSLSNPPVIDGQLQEKAHTDGQGDGADNGKPVLPENVFPINPFDPVEGETAGCRRGGT